MILYFYIKRLKKCRQSSLKPITNHLKKLKTSNSLILFAAAFAALLLLLRQKGYKIISLLKGLKRLLEFYRKGLIMR